MNQTERTGFEHSPDSTGNPHSQELRDTKATLLTNVDECSPPAEDARSGESANQRAYRILDTAVRAMRDALEVIRGFHLHESVKQHYSNASKGMEQAIESFAKVFDI